MQSFCDIIKIYFKQYSHVVHNKSELFYCPCKQTITARLWIFNTEIGVVGLDIIYDIRGSLMTFTNAKART